MYREDVALELGPFFDRDCNVIQHVSAPQWHNSRFGGTILSSPSSFRGRISSSPQLPRSFHLLGDPLRYPRGISKNALWKLFGYVDFAKAVSRDHVVSGDISLPPALASCYSQDGGGHSPFFSSLPDHMVSCPDVPRAKTSCIRTDHGAQDETFTPSRQSLLSATRLWPPYSLPCFSISVVTTGRTSRSTAS